MWLIAILILLSALILCVLPWVSPAFTVMHAVEELLGENGPLWEYFGRLTGARINGTVGFLVFTVGLTVALCTVSALAYDWITVSHEWQAFWLAVLVGARLGDSLFSHWLLWIFWERPNPGLATTGLYVIELALLAVVWMIGTCDPSWPVSHFPKSLPESGVKGVEEWPPPYAAARPPEGGWDVRLVTQAR